jgi:hypothetical protein
MAMQEYKINYVDGTTQVFPSTGPQAKGDWLVFADGSGEQLRVRADQVESVIRDDIPERTGQSPKAA